MRILLWKYFDCVAKCILSDFYEGFLLQQEGSRNFTEASFSSRKAAETLRRLPPRAGRQQKLYGGFLLHPEGNRNFTEASFSSRKVIVCFFKIVNG
jgi:hypothetical protein